MADKDHRVLLHFNFIPYVLLNEFGITKLNGVLASFWVILLLMSKKL